MAAAPQNQQKSAGQDNVVAFRKKSGPDKEALRLMRIADEIDAVILKHLNAETVDPKDLAGLLAHRLGTLMRHLDGKDILWDVCEKVLKKQAAID
jgi:hypothetical protein